MSEIIRYRYLDATETQRFSEKTRKTIHEAYIAGVEAGCWGNPVLLASPDLTSIFLVRESADGSFDPSDAVAIFEDGTYSMVKYRPVE